MASTRRIGSQTSASRDAIVHAAIKLLQEQGAANLTAAKVAEMAGVKAHLVHYYFRTIDDLIIAVVRAFGSMGLKNTAKIIASDEPLRALWKLEISSAWGAGAIELGALAANREAVRIEMARNMEDMRNIQAEGIARHLELRGIEPPVSPMALCVLFTCIARSMVREKALGMTLGHNEAVAVIEQMLSSLPKKRRPDAPGR